ncbi:hypothetical protein [Streptomyces sp. NPDC054863]
MNSAVAPSPDLGWGVVQADSEPDLGWGLVAGEEPGWGLAEDDLGWG